MRETVCSSPKITGLEDSSWGRNPNPVAPSKMSLLVLVLYSVLVGVQEGKKREPGKFIQFA
jgi:hypothetical protein